MISHVPTIIQFSDNSTYFCSFFFFLMCVFFCYRINNDLSRVISCYVFQYILKLSTSGAVDISCPSASQIIVVMFHHLAFQGITVLLWISVRTHALLETLKNAKFVYTILLPKEPPRSFRKLWIWDRQVLLEYYIQFTYCNSNLCEHLLSFV